MLGWFESTKSSCCKLSKDRCRPRRFKWLCRTGTWIRWRLQEWLPLYYSSQLLCIWSSQKHSLLSLRPHKLSLGLCRSGKRICMSASPRRNFEKQWILCLTKASWFEGRIGSWRISFCEATGQMNSRRFHRPYLAFLPLSGQFYGQ